jgi:hypothetical protein
MSNSGYREMLKHSRTRVSIEDTWDKWEMDGAADHTEKCDIYPYYDTENDSGRNVIPRMLERQILYITNIMCNSHGCIIVYEGGVMTLHVRRHFSLKYYNLFNTILKEINVLYVFTKYVLNIGN